MFQAARHLVDRLTIAASGWLKVIGFVREMGDVNSTDASAISVLTPITYLSQSGAAQTRTLAAGKEGQVKRLLCVAYAADVVVTAALEGSHTTITFNALGDYWEGIYHNGEWWTLMLGFSTGTGPVIG